MNIWVTEKDGWIYKAEIKGNKLELSRHNGTPQSYGYRQIQIKSVLSKKRWQDLVREYHGGKILQEIMTAIQNLE